MEENGGMTGKQVGKKRRKIVENKRKMEEHGGMPGKKQEKTTENEGKSLKTGGNGGKQRNDRKKVESLKTGGKWRKMEEHGGMPGKKQKKRQKMNENR